MKLQVILFSLLVAASAALPATAQDRPRPGGPDREARAAEAKAKLAEQAAAYYANADSALYGVRYLFSYLYNKEKNLTFKEDRVVLISPRVSVERSYEGIGETRWRNANPNSQGDPSLAYRLTPDYHFYYPDSARQVYTYRIIGDEYLVSDGVCPNSWTITDEHKKMGEYDARKATLSRDGRDWTAWFTTDLPCQGAPSYFNGLPGVVLELSDATGEVAWTFHSIVENLPDDQLFVKFPDALKTVEPERLAKIIKVFALTGNGTLQNLGLMEGSNPFPEKYRPSTGVDACLIDNPIVR